MGGIKRKDAPVGSTKNFDKKQKTADIKTPKFSKPASKAPSKYARPAPKPSHLQAAADKDLDEEDEEQVDSFEGFDEDGAPQKSQKDDVLGKKQYQNGNGSKQFKLDSSSAEAHAKQRALAKERRAAKPNADAIQRSKQLWERLRRKSHVQKEERKELVAELFSLIEGKVRDFVFKHDSVRVIQCAIKYARSEQLKTILQELKGDIRDLVESRYGKFLVAKLVVQGDRADKDTIIPAFYGHVKRLINHPEASWIVDDIYRQVATPKQKAIMLREWYGAEFSLSHRNKTFASTEEATADLPAILEQNPEKRKVILNYLQQMINNLVQKKMTGFTMLHDAMLQYFLALEPGSEEHSDFLETLKGDIDADEEGGGGDLFKNLAFTKSGSHLLCLVLAYGSAKDRKVVLKCFKENIEIMAFDQFAKLVLVVGLDVPDDTRLTFQSIIRELLGLQNEDTTQRLDRLEGILTNPNSRLPVLYPLAGSAKWLMKDHERELMDKVHQIRQTTSKKAPEIRRKELLQHMSDPLLDLVAQRAGSLVQSSFACQPITEILLECTGEHREAAKASVAGLARGDPLAESTSLDEGVALDEENPPDEPRHHVAKDPAASRMLKTLVFGGNFDPIEQKVRVVEPALGFGATLYPVVKPHLVDWACSDSSFVALALLDSDDVSEKIKKDVRAVLLKSKKRIAVVAEGSGVMNGKQDAGDKKSKKRKVEAKGNSGARMILERLSEM